MRTSHPYFAYGTTQKGFPHHRELYDLLGEPVGRFRTVEPYAIVVPHAAACSNPGCRFVHRMAALVRGDWDVHAEGDVFLVSDEALAALDRLELAGPYTRASVRVDEYVAQAYPASEPDRWAELGAARRSRRARRLPARARVGEHAQAVLRGHARARAAARRDRHRIAAMSTFGRACRSGAGPSTTLSAWSCWCTATASTSAATST